MFDENRSKTSSNSPWTPANLLPNIVHPNSSSILNDSGRSCGFQESAELFKTLCIHIIRDTSVPAVEREPVIWLAEWTGILVCVNLPPPSFVDCALVFTDQLHEHPFLP